MSDKLLLQVLDAVEKEPGVNCFDEPTSDDIVEDSMNKKYITFLLFFFFYLFL